MSHKKVHSVFAGVVLVTVLAAVPVSAEAGGLERRGGANVWSVAMEWIAERWSGIGEVLTPSWRRGTPRNGRARDQDKKGSMLDPNG